MSPFPNVDKSGELTGYDIEVLRLLERTDPTLKFEFATVRGYMFS